MRCLKGFVLGRECASSSPLLVSLLLLLVHDLLCRGTMRCALALKGAHTHPCLSRGPYSSRLSDGLTCANNALQCQALCTPAGRAVQPVLAAFVPTVLAGAPCLSSSNCRCSLSACVSQLKNACRRTGPACALLAPLTASRTQPLTQVRV